MKILKNISFVIIGSLVNSPLAYAISPPSTEIATEAKLPQFKDLITGTESDDPKGLLTELLKLAIGIFATIAIVFLIIAGYQYLTAAGDEEKAKKGKGALIYSVIGMTIVALSYGVQTVFDKLKVATGGNVTDSIDAFQTEAESFMNSIVDGVTYLTGTIAVIFIIVGAYQYLTAAGDEEKAKKGTKALIYSVLGLMVMVLARAIVQVFYKTGTPGTNLGTRIVDVQGIVNLLTSIIEFSATLVGVVSVLMLIYAGFLWITAGGDETQAGKAKKIVIYSIVGLTVIIFSVVIVNLVIHPTA